MSVLFGTVEYFEREIIKYLKESHSQGIKNASIDDISIKLENELLYDFICADNIRLECLSNLKYVTDILKKKELVLT